MDRRDIIVVGASAGGIETISRLLGQLPDNLAATILVVQHLSASSPGTLAAIFDKACPLSVDTASDGDHLEQGKVYVAPPDCHMLISDGLLQVVKGPKENRFRPAIDPLFRSAAATYGPRVIGIILSGLLDDGAAGLLAIRRCNGTTIVQQPSDAFNPQMPEAALRLVNPDHCLPVAKMAELLAKLIAQPAKAVVPIPEDIITEVKIAAQTTNTFPVANTLGALVSLSCPECGGPLRELGDANFKRYRCEVGHGFTQRSLLDEQKQMLERALWVAMRTFEENAALHESLAHEAASNNQENLARDHQQHAEQAHNYVGQLRKILAAQL